MFKSILLLGMLSFSMSAFALGGGQLGNGADAVVCLSSYKTTAELLDVYEARALWNKKWKDDYAYQTPDDAAIQNDVAAGDLGELDAVLPVKSKRLREYLSTFLDEANFVYGAELTDIPDSLEIALPSGCRIAQLVIQVPNPMPGQKRYTVNGDIWNLLDRSNKAATMLHEVIYRDQVVLGHTDSRWTRFLNVLVGTEQISKMSPNEIKSLMASGSTETFEHNGFILAGPKDLQRSIYQILGKASSSNFSYNAVDGRYDLKNDRLLDFTTVDSSSMFDVEFPKGFGVTLQGNNVSKLFTREGWVSKDVSFVTRNLDVNDFNVATLVQPKAGQPLVFEGLSSEVFAHFDNGVSVSVIADRLKKGLSVGTTLADFTKLAGCQSGVCEDKLFKIRFASGLVLSDYLKTLSFVDRNVISAEFTPSAMLSYSLPSGVDAETYAYRFSLDAVNFDANGGFITTLVALPQMKLMTKAKKALTLDVGSKYEFSFDHEGYLLGAKKK